MFFDRLVKLCEQNGISPTKLTSELGIGASNVTRWKAGAVPHKGTVKKIADYFNVPVESLITDKVISIDEKEGLTPEIISILTDPKLKSYILLTKKAADQGLPPEVLEKIIELQLEIQNKKESSR